jgi:hypothetical protein
MIGRRASLGLSLLSVVLLWALPAQSASAAPTTSFNTTAFTCTLGFDDGDFKDAHCDVKGTPGKEKYRHVAIPLDSTIEITATNANVTSETAVSEPAVFKGTAAIVKTEIECSTVKNVGKNSWVHNTQPLLEKNHTFEGSVETEYSSCFVRSPSKCTVKSPILAKAKVHAVQGLEGPKGEKNAMGLEFIGSGKEETLAEITYEGAECALKGNTFPVKGKMYATSGPTTESAQENKASGATLVFTPKFGMEELKLGTNAAEFTSIVTATSGASAISLTTTT